MGGFEQFLISILPLTIVMIPLAFAAGWLAPKIGDHRWVWVVLFLVPVFNYIAMIVLWFRVAGRILDRLNALAPAPESDAPTT
jgi:hypothetical protein